MVVTKTNVVNTTTREPPCQCTQLQVMPIRLSPPPLQCGGRPGFQLRRTFVRRAIDRWCQWPDRCTHEARADSVAPIPPLKEAKMTERLETLNKARARMLEDRDMHAKVLAAPFDRDKAERARNKFIEIQVLIDALDRAISGEGASR